MEPMGESHLPGHPKPIPHLRVNLRKEDAHRDTLLATLVGCSGASHNLYNVHNSLGIILGNANPTVSLWEGPGINKVIL